jgi:ABC-2 type transport system permease protein
MQMGPFGGSRINPNPVQTVTNEPYVIAARIQGTVKSAAPAEDALKKGDALPEPPKTKEAKIDVVLVADVDMLSPEIFSIRERGPIVEAGINFDFDNVTFILDALDELADEPRFIEIRNRRLTHRTLSRIDESTRDARQKVTAARQKFSEDLKAEQQKLEKEITDAAAEFRKQKGMDPTQMAIKLMMMQEDRKREMTVKIEQFRQKREVEIKEIERGLAAEVRQIQNRYKMWAVLLPPIPPLVVALVVFFTRRRREREGVARSRLK